MRNTQGNSLFNPPNPHGTMSNFNSAAQPSIGATLEEPAAVELNGALQGKKKKKVKKSKKMVENAYGSVDNAYSSVDASNFNSSQPLQGIGQSALESVGNNDPNMSLNP